MSIWDPTTKFIPASVNFGDHVKHNMFVQIMIIVHSPVWS